MLRTNTKTITENDFFANILAAIDTDSVEPKKQPKPKAEPFMAVSTAALIDYKTTELHLILDRLIDAGITFDVSETDFQVIDSAKVLKNSDMNFLEINDQTILCHLQQSLLMKHLFSHSPEKFEDFAFEVRERESLLSTPLKTSFELYFEAVRSVTQKWFAELLGEILKPVSAFIN